MVRGEGSLSLSKKFLLSYKRKAKEVIASRPALSKIVKGVLQAVGKLYLKETQI